MARAERRRKVAFVINSLAGGGAERVMSTLLRASERETDRVDLILVLLDREPAAYDLPEWVKVEQLDAGHSLLRSVMQLFLLLRQIRPDGILSFLTRANLAATLVGRVLAIPTVISERVNTTSHLGRGIGARLARVLIKLCYPWARRIIAVSDGVAEDLVTNFGIAQPSISVIPNPVDLDAIAAAGRAPSPLSLSEPYVMAMGRLVPNKNFAMLIEAFAKAGLDEKLLILGEGPERERLASLIARLGIAERVEMPGFCANPYAILSRACWFVLPSNAEGFPNSLVEAMALGVPVISTNCPSGPSEVLAEKARSSIAGGVVHAPHGLLVPMNAVAEMTSALQAMADASLRSEYAVRAAQRAADFSVGRARSAYWNILYAEMAAASGSAIPAFRVQ